MSDADTLSQDLASLHSQINYEKLATEVYQLSYEPCLEKCQRFITEKDIKSQKNQKYFGKDELACVYNCVKKSQGAMNMLLNETNDYSSKDFM
ncbi:unnamed protein product [Moneuplotes crassus]|uniref:Uncharacterized protein n=1 Tax=Euplotes crassus TaxID=5936 RepID=A0AAD2D7G0_EUPCR|nr:unnamed protein product [Moneuplotes crassus]